MHLKKIILGSDDPEMKKIEEIIIKLNYDYSYALFNNKRVAVNEAYKANNFFAEDIESFLFIESNIPIYNNKKNTYFDHHHEGDFGYHLDHNHFLAASSLGQFFKYILFNDFDNVIETLCLTVSNNNDNPKYKNHYFFKNDEWFLNFKGFDILIPKDIVLSSAIDHSLAEAYKGNCIGINSDDLFFYRLKELSIHNNLSESYIYQLFNFFHELFEETSSILDLTYISFINNHYSIEYLIIREISLYRNIPTAIKICLDNIDKIMFLSLSSFCVEKLLSESKFNNLELENMFGVPNRGYAGGFIKK